MRGRDTIQMTLLVLALGASPADAQTGTQSGVRGNPNCPPPVINGITPKNWSCPTGTQTPPNLPTAGPAEDLDYGMPHVADFGQGDAPLFGAGGPPFNRGAHEPLQDILDRISEFWQAVFTACGFGSYSPPATYALTARDINADLQAGQGMVPARYNGRFAFSTRTAFYVPSFASTWPINFQQTILLNEANLFGDLPARFGDNIAEIILAHESGHRAQDLLGTSRRNPHTWTPQSRRQEELEADYLAGAYLNWLRLDNRLPMGLTALGGESRKFAGDDYTRTPRNSLASHGSSNERVDAFMAGVNTGLLGSFCTTRRAYP